MTSEASEDRSYQEMREFIEDIRADTVRGAPISPARINTLLWMIESLIQKSEKDRCGI
jgi:hypothetical protein